MNSDGPDFTMGALIANDEKKINGGVITLWAISFLSLLGGIAFFLAESTGECKEVGCSLAQVTQLSLGVMGICASGFFALLGFLVLKNVEKQNATRLSKEEELLKDALHKEENSLGGE